MVGHARLRWFGHLERTSVDDWVSACRKVEVAGVRCKGRNRKTWKQCVDDDMKVLGLHPEWALIIQGYVCGGTSYGTSKRLTLA